MLAAIARRLAAGPQVPHVARQGAAQVHGRRLRRRGLPRAGRGAPGPPARGRRRAAAPDERARTTLGSTRRSRTGLFYVGFPVHLGLMTASRWSGWPTWPRAAAATSASPASRTSSWPTSPRRGWTRSSGEIGELGFPLDVNRAARHVSIGCTGDPLCNYAVAETKAKLRRDRRAPGGDASARRSTGCGSTSTAARTPAPTTGSATSASRARRCASAAPAGEQLEAYEIFLRGGARARAPRSAGRSCGACRATRSKSYIERLVPRLSRRSAGRASASSSSSPRHADEELLARSGWRGAGRGRRRRGLERKTAIMMERATAAQDRPSATCWTNWRPASWPSSSTTTTPAGSHRAGRSSAGARSARDLHQLPGRRHGHPRHGLADRPRGARLHRRHRPPAAGDLRR